MNSVNTLKLLIAEAAKSVNQMPKELAALTRHLRMKISSDAAGLAQRASARRSALSKPRRTELGTSSC